MRIALESRLAFEEFASSLPGWSGDLGDLTIAQLRSNRRLGEIMAAEEIYREGFAAGVAFARALHLLQAEAAAGSLAEVVAVPDTRWRHRRRST